MGPAGPSPAARRSPARISSSRAFRDLHPAVRPRQRLRRAGLSHPPPPHRGARRVRERLGAGAGARRIRQPRGAADAHLCRGLHRTAATRLRRVRPAPPQPPPPRQGDQLAGLPQPRPRRGGLRHRRAGTPVRRLRRRPRQAGRALQRGARADEGLLDGAGDRLRGPFLEPARRHDGAQAGAEALPAGLVRRQRARRHAPRGSPRRRVHGRGIPDDRRIYASRWRW